MLEQLYYTWVFAGYGSSAGEQVAAASPGLQDQRGPMAQAAATLCRTPGDAVVFSWKTDRGVRYAARRQPAGKDGKGRAGRFFVHLVAGSESELTPGVLAGLLTATGWVRDVDDPDHVNPALPLLALADLQGSAAPGPAAPDAPRAAETALAGALLGQVNRQPLVLDLETPEQAAAVAAAVSGALSSTQNQVLLSFSTAEKRGEASKYDTVHRVDGAHAFPLLSSQPRPPAMAAARALLGDQTLIERLWARSDSLLTVTRRALAIGDYRAGAAASAEALAALVAEDPALWPTLLAEDGPAQLAQHLRSRDRWALSALRSLPEEQFHSLVAHFGSASGGGSRTGDLLVGLAAANPAFADSVAFQWRDTSDPALRAAVAVTLSRVRSRHTVTLGKLIRADPHAARAVLSDRTLPQGDRALALAAAALHPTELAREWAAEDGLFAASIAGFGLLPETAVRAYLGAAPTDSALRQLADARRQRPPADLGALTLIGWEILRDSRDPLPRMVQYARAHGMPEQAAPLAVERVVATTNQHASNRTWAVADAARLSHYWPWRGPDSGTDAWIRLLRSLTTNQPIAVELDPALRRPGRRAALYLLLQHNVAVGSRSWAMHANEAGVAALNAAQALHPETRRQDLPEVVAEQGLLLDRYDESGRAGVLCACLHWLVLDGRGPEKYDAVTRLREGLAASSREQVARRLDASFAKRPAKHISWVLPPPPTPSARGRGVRR